MLEKCKKPCWKRGAVTNGRLSKLVREGGHGIGEGKCGGYRREKRAVYENRRGWRKNGNRVIYERREELYYTKIQ